MRFKLEIELGNDSMRTYADLSAALITARDTCRDELVVGETPQVGHTRKLRDANGNPVGKWEVTA